MIRSEPVACVKSVNTEIFFLCSFVLVFFLCSFVLVFFLLSLSLFLSFFLSDVSVCGILPYSHAYLCL